MDKRICIFFLVDITVETTTEEEIDDMVNVEIKDESKDGM